MDKDGSPRTLPAKYELAMPKTAFLSLTPEVLGEKILTIRNTRVMIDSDLAELYGVKTKVLNQAVKRNGDRFPATFMFQLTAGETKELVTSCDRFEKLKHSSVPPKAFTEHGVLMLANILSSSIAISVSILIIEAFVNLRSTVITHSDLTKKIALMETRLADHDEQFQIFHELILPFLAIANPSRKKIGFRDPKEED